MARKVRPIQRRKTKVKRPPGRPPKDVPKGYYDERMFIEAVREQFSPKELLIFKLSVARLKTLSEEWRSDGVYPKRSIKHAADAVKASEINGTYIWQCLGMDRNQYNQFIKYVQMDAAGAEEKSSLLAKKYALARYYRERYTVMDDTPIKKQGTTDCGLTFEQFEDLVKIAIWDREALLDKFQKSRQRPQRIKPPSEPPV